MEQKVNLQFSLGSDNFRLLENDGYCSIAEVDFLHLGVNRNKCNITRECVENSLQSFYNKPLLCILDNSFSPSLSVDFKEHARSEEEKNNFIAFGTIPESSSFRFLERDNGKTYLSAKVVIWKNYFPIIMNILKRREGSVKVSIELAVIEGEQDDNTGILDINKFRLLSCVLLGEGIMEGIEGSHLDILKFSFDDEVKKANEYYLNFSQNNTKYEIPEEVQNAVQEGLNSYKDIGKGCTTQEVAMAKKIANETYIEKKQVDKIFQKISTSKEKNKSLTFDILGGEVMENWVNSIQNMDENDKERVGDNGLKSLSNNELQEQLWQELGRYKYHDGEWEGRKYYVEEIYSDEKVAIVRDNETAEYYKIPYEIDNGKVVVNMDNKKLVHRTYEETEKTFSKDSAVVFAKKDYGTGEAITVDKSKEALSETSWGSVNKTELRKKVLEAKNYKSLVKDVYADVQEGWEDAPSSKLKYPIMEIKDGKAVYNRYGLASALAYAEKNNETAVVNKVKSLYKKLDIDKNNEGGEKKMAKELEKDKEVVENKLDKDNKDIEKIRDDADAQEDDVKEKEKKEVKNSDKCDDIGFAEEKKNKIEKDDKGEEGLEDDVDADKDYWKKKANSLEVKNAEMEAELKKYKREDEERQMAAEVDKFAHCMSEEEAQELKNSIKECTMAEMKEKINAKVAEFALKIKNAEEKSKEIKYSINPIYELNTMKFSKAEIKNLDDIISNSHADIAGK